MFEVAGLFLIMCLVAASAFFPIGYSIFFDSSKKGRSQVVMLGESMDNLENRKITEDSGVRRHCLTNLQAEIESAFAPRPTDSVLQRHYDTLIAFELEKRLAELELTA